MKKLFLLAILLSTFLIFQNCELVPYLEKEGDGPQKVQKVELEINSEALQGNLFGDPALRKVSVYLPPRYGKDIFCNYPVIYVMHGQPGGENAIDDPDAWQEFKDLYVNTIPIFEQGANFPKQGFINWLTQLMNNGTIQPSIIVVPDTRSTYLLPYGTNSILHGNVEDFITDELVPLIDDQFRTLPHPQHRGIIGHCVGGYSAMRLGIKHPNIFGHIGGLSPLHITRDVIEGMIPIMVQENPQGWAGPHPYKFFTSGMYGAAAAWTPNPESPDLVNMPIDLASQTFIEPVAQVWDMNSIFALLQIYSANIGQLESIYFDCGDKDELNSLLTNDGLSQYMTSLGIQHEYEVYDGYHVSHFYDRLAVSLNRLTEKMAF